MKIGITYRLFLAMLIATGLAILSLFLIMRWSIDRGFYQYLGKMDQSRLERVVNDVAEAYDETESWDFLQTAPPQLGSWRSRCTPRHENRPSAIWRTRV